MASARLQTAHTAELESRTLEAARALLYAVFTGDDAMTEHDWEHCLGGVHALVRDEDELIAHGAVVQRRLLYGGRMLRTGYIEGVAVRADRRGEGHGAAVMEALERVVRGAYELGALGSSEIALGFYAARGWRVWRGPTSALTPDGLRRTPDEDEGIYVLPVSVELDLTAPIACDWRDGSAW